VSLLWGVLRPAEGVARHPIHLCEPARRTRPSVAGQRVRLGPAPAPARAGSGGGAQWALRRYRGPNFACKSWKTFCSTTAS
jgi:hypothetical protein